MEKSRIIEKIRKLLARTESCNEHESQLALEKAQSLMLEHDLSEDDVSSNQTDRHFVFVDAHVGYRRSPECRFVEEIVHSFFFCEIVYVSRFKDGPFERAVQVFGDEHHAEIGRYVFVFLCRTFRSLWNQRRAEDKMLQRQSYYYGLQSELFARLATQRRAAAKASKASLREGLIKVREDLAAELRKHLPDATAARPDRRVPLDWESAHAGMQDGENVHIQTPLPDGGTPAQKLLN